MKFLVIEGDNSYEFELSSCEKASKLYELVDEHVDYDYEMRDENSVHLNPEYPIYKYYGSEENLLIKLYVKGWGATNEENESREDGESEEDDESDNSINDSESEDGSGSEDGSESEDECGEDCDNPICNILNKSDNILNILYDLDKKIDYIYTQYSDLTMLGLIVTCGIFGFGAMVGASIATHYSV